MSIEDRFRQYLNNPRHQGRWEFYAWLLGFQPSGHIRPTWWPA